MQWGAPYRCQPKAGRAEEGAVTSRLSHTSGHLAGERDQLCEHHGGGDLLVP